MILLTGATGFVGSHILEELIKSKLKTKIVVRESSIIKLDNVDLKDVNICFIDDLFSATDDEIDTILKDVKIIIHSAWYVEHGSYLTSTKNLECLSGTLNLARAASRNHITKFVGLGTCYEYDLSRGVLTIDSPLNPNTLYGAAKVATYYSLREFFLLEGISFSWCRLFYLYGPRENPNRLVPSIRNSLTRGIPIKLTTGTQIRDYINVIDAAKMIVKISNSSSEGSFNISTGKGLSVRKLAETIADEYNRRDLLRFGERPENLTEPQTIIGVVRPIGQT